jgi:hypothetical protein
MAITACGLGAVTLVLCGFGYVLLLPLMQLLHLGMHAIMKVMLPPVLTGGFLLLGGLPDLSASASKGAIGRSGTMMRAVSIFGVLQGLPLILTPEKWMASFAHGDVHDTTRTIVMMVLPLWGICITGAALTRIAIVQSGHTASIYSANRATAFYYAQLVGALAITKTYNPSSSAAMTVQLWAAFVYLSLSYFGGTVADDMKVKQA